MLYVVCIEFAYTHAFGKSLQKYEQEISQANRMVWDHSAGKSFPYQRRRRNSLGLNRIGVLRWFRQSTRSILSNSLKVSRIIESTAGKVWRAIHDIPTQICVLRGGLWMSSKKMWIYNFVGFFSQSIETIDLLEFIIGNSIYFFDDIHQSIVETPGS